jgi:hypothetical protein
MNSSLERKADGKSIKSTFGNGVNKGWFGDLGFRGISKDAIRKSYYPWLNSNAPAINIVAVSRRIVNKPYAPSIGDWLQYT